MKETLPGHSDLVVLSACYLAPLFFSWSYSPILTVVLSIVTLAGFVATVYMEEPTQASWIPSAAVTLLCSKALVLSMMTVPSWPILNFMSLLCYLFYLFVAFQVISSGSKRVSGVVADFSKTLKPGKLMAITADLQAGNIDQPQAEEKRNCVRRENIFYDGCDGLAWCLRYEVAGTFLTLLVLGISEPLYIVGHLFLSLLISVSLGMLISRSGTDSNLS